MWVDTVIKINFGMQHNIKSLSVQRYKGFCKKTTVEFATPVNKKKGSGLTILVGPNNAGKTSLLEALLKFTNCQLFYEDELNSVKDKPKLVLKDQEDEEIIIDSLEGISEKPNSIKEIVIVPCRRSWNQNVQSYSLAFKDLTRDYQRNYLKERHGIDARLASLLASICKDGSLKKDFDRIIKRVIPDFGDWRVSRNIDDGDKIKYKTISGAEHTISFTGEGLLSLFKIAAYLTQSSRKENIIIIDEPELSLHPQAQKELAKVFSEKSKDMQIIISTHSPYFVNMGDFLNGGNLVRFHKNPEGECIADVTKSSILGKFRNSIKDYQKPYFFDHVAKEVFFAVNIVFVEGPEDVGLLRSYMEEKETEEKEEINFEFFGYGCGGADQIKNLLELAESLGFEKAGALFDGNKGKTYKKCKRKFEKYHIEKLPVDDIRDKPYQKLKKNGRCKDKDEGKRGKLAIEGIFSRSGKIKETQKEKLDKIINNFVDYFQSKASRKPSDEVKETSM